MLIEKSDLKAKVSELTKTVEQLSRRIATLERAVQSVAPRVRFHNADDTLDTLDALDDHMCTIA